MANITGKRVAVLVTTGVEEVELVRPVEFLRGKGALVTIITPIREEWENVFHSLNSSINGNSLYADAWLQQVSPNDFDAIFIPGGYSPDHLRLRRERWISSRRSRIN